MTSVLYLLLVANAIVALTSPWVGLIGAYLIAILAPHNIWWWLFDGIRPFYWVMLPTVAGFGIALLRGKISWVGLSSRINACMAILWLSFTISYYFGPFVDVVNDSRFYDPAVMFPTLQITFFTFFIGVALIDSTKKLKWATLVIVVTGLYMTYWANYQYFGYGKFGRLHGPINQYGNGIYFDENNFAVLFVTGFPFVFYLGYYLRNKIAKYALWLTVPFMWHAVFLTASRGALVAIGAVLAVFALRLKSRTAGALVIAAFVAAFAWQAGDVMKDRSSTIAAYESENSANARLEAWDAAIGMMMDHPLTGVGFASFGQAFPTYSDKPPRVAHNTFFQIGGEWGVIAGLTYLIVVLSTVSRLIKNGNQLRVRDTQEEDQLLYCINEASMLSLVGFFVCSMFLSLQGYEIFYYLLVLSNATLFASRGWKKLEVTNKPLLRRAVGRGTTDMRNQHASFDK